ncbi:P-loop containing nucleoside triphosphate hydrolase protein [Lactarius quietus]|nr:P-loop containing nucleoside triphosphate hydrolase protein [Lactarius quietus]
MPGFRFPMEQQYLKGDALKEFSVDLTELAKTGKLDPVIGRDEEIRRTIQILSRRTKSNPVFIGPPRVGKTAILEGLASRIVAKEVPGSLHNKLVLSIDLSAIMAGSGVRDQFEEKFKALIRDIEDEPVMAGGMICFIDEVHTLFNLGKAEGSIDGGQRIKPALARELQLVGATTQKLSAKTRLERRFQPVTIEEPTVESTISFLRGLTSRYEGSAVYSARHISDRFLPDKAIDLVDEAASSHRLAQESKPDALEQLDRAAMTMQIELTSLRNESDPLSAERREALKQALERTRKEAAVLEEQWQAEQKWLQHTKEWKRCLEEAKHELEVARRKGDYEGASRLRYATIPELERSIPTEGSGSDAMLGERVTSEDIAHVAACATGIPEQSLLKGERERLVHMEDALRAHVVGQDHVVGAISNAVRISRAGLQAPMRLWHSIILTELCKVLAVFLFNDEHRALIDINISEYHDQHTTSRLIGAAPGCVGFEEGGKISEASSSINKGVRRKPYAVVLLNELEKAHRDVVKILQMLDEGTITDSQGGKVDSKVRPTSLVSSDILAHPSASDSSSSAVTPEVRIEVLERVKEEFPPELLNRLDSMLVFNRLTRSSILRVVDLWLADVAARLAQRCIKLNVDDAAHAWLAQKGFSDLYGARAVARVMRSEVLFPLAQKLLVGTIRDGDMVEIQVGTDRMQSQMSDNHVADERDDLPAVQGCQ